MKFDLNEVIKISEYVRVGHQSNSEIKTKALVNEYLEEKRLVRINEAIDWWKHLSEKDKWNKTINNLKHYSDFEKEDVLELWLSCGYGA